MTLAPAYQDWRFVVTVVLLLLSSLGVEALSVGHEPPPRKELALLPHQIAPWDSKDIPIEPGVEELLGAKDLVNRVYWDADSQIPIGLFIAFFDSQRQGGAIHSPKNCLPGAGWSAVQASTTTLSVPGSSEPLRVNLYIIQKDLDRQVVLYWYQSQGRVIASEYSAKLYLMWDALTRRRSDGALVRIVTPIFQGDTAGATRRATSFAQTALPLLTPHIPG